MPCAKTANFPWARRPQLAVFAHTPLTDGRSPPVLSSAFARSYHIDPSPISLGAAPKTAFLLRSIFQLVFFFLSNITSKSASLNARKCSFFFTYGGSNHRFSSDAVTTRPYRHLGETVVSGTQPKIIFFYFENILSTGRSFCR